MKKAPQVLFSLLGRASRFTAETLPERLKMAGQILAAAGHRTPDPK
ncbi:hypothetical protein ACCUM_1059 [Candidatus Accumulibacter phosphatis]|uniref:Uncharacterized protein n=1 Tax=Candidatus Accumulibacter phosphatis TaxID=327160 RepID=A0A5S4EGR8_9PROT|nr:hypothetical protein ACCUM_1059 [Candidatus Accumulibacter phosphatis]